MAELYYRYCLPLVAVLLAACLPGTAPWAQGVRSCPGDDSGLTLPAGFCATVFADGLGHARHLVMAPNGVLYVNTWSGRYYGGGTPHAGGFLVALQDTTGAGKANLIERFGETVQSGGAGGTGIAYYHGALYAEINDRIVRYALGTGSIVPAAGTTVVSGLPLSGDHPMHPFAIDDDGHMYIDVASATNACQRQNRQPGSPGLEPCKELKTRGGVWRYDADKSNQIFSAAARFATGIRNAEGFGLDRAGHRIFVTQHGRDQLHTNWPAYFQPEQEATLPAEELLLLTPGGDYGWPMCYYDPFRNQLVLAPEFGGDGGDKRGDCAQKLAPLATFPAHWAPNDMVYYDQPQFPLRYRSGVFIAFHGSWNRAPYVQAGYNVVFQELAAGNAAGRCEIFADGFAGGVKSPDQAMYRPAGVAVGNDGSLYVADDVRGRIYRIVYRSDAEAAGGAATFTPCPSAALPPEPVKPAEAGSSAHNGAAPVAANLPVPVGATREMVLLGDRIYHGQKGGASCTGCHGLYGTGTPLGPSVSDATWLWGNGSYESIRLTIQAGVPLPKAYRNPMPPMGGAQLSQEEVAALAAYVWALGHR